MAYGSNRVGYQYETSPRKLKPEYEPRKNPYAKNVKFEDTINALKKIVEILELEVVAT